ncbi:NADH dehydrogenase FAD-containing subunit [Streptomyces sp. 3211.6]|uniref:NAD(P)/FAD-dependent oxidoreductase n=1 Tax=Streptomyces sp. 3211.6 TaxID=1938845 RepID=UPI000C2BA447|nr:FAD-dependent oxidoreductase [Streptomyces sp. 3211.6]RKT05544.1 NADH dehydrogenase FAD-containing subunit [Streptomyces sp. 3211.6]
MKVVVVGAGYAGLLAANRLAKKVKAAEIAVINPRPHFVERVRLHQQVAGTAVAAAPLTSMLCDGITSRVAAVDKIGDGSVALDDGTSLDFDYAFLAVGSTVQPMPGSVPVGTWEGAEQARAALAALPAGNTVTVIGGGATGIETAAEVAEARPDLRVRIVGSAVAGGFSHRAYQRVRSGLVRLKVDVVDDGVTEVVGGIVHLRSGAAFASDLTLWAIVSGVPDLAARSGLKVDSEGRALVDEYLRSVDDERIFVVGDCAAVPGARFACALATPQAAHAANTLARLSEGRKPEPYALRYVARAVTLGRKNAVGQFTRPDDTLRRAYVTGRTAVVIKELASRGGKYGARTGTGA